MPVDRRPARRIGRALRAFCVLLTATLALFVLLNVFAAYWYPRDTRAVLSGQPVFDDRLKSVYEGIYGLPIAVVREIVAESFMENAWIFEPYVQFREQPRQGRFVNISTDGFRLNGGTDRKTFDPARSFPVFLFGGSTTFGYGLRDEDTIATHLEAVLRRHYPDQAHRIAVYNFGRGYYGSTQEVLLLKSLVQREIVPKVVVFIDGVNEQFCPTYSANLAEMFKIVQHDPAAQLREVIASLPVTRLVSSSYRTELATNALYVNRALAGYAFECRCPREDVCHMQLVRTWALNKQLVRAMAREFGFEAHFVLQPVGGYRNRFTTSPYGAKRPDHSWFLWGLFERHALNGQNDYSFTGILEDYQGEAFVDMLHYSAGANRLIAERLYEKMAPSIAKTLDVAGGAPPAPADRVEAFVHVAADPATVFSYFTVPARLAQWAVRSANVQPVRNGAFHLQVGEGAWIRGTFLEIDPPRRFVLALPLNSAPASRVEIAFSPDRTGTLVRVTHTGVPPSEAPGYRGGWNDSLVRLSLAVAKIQAGKAGPAVAK